MCSTFVFKSPYPFYFFFPSTLMVTNRYFFLSIDTGLSIIWTNFTGLAPCFLGVYKPIAHFVLFFPIAHFKYSYMLWLPSGTSGKEPACRFRRHNETQDQSLSWKSSSLEEGKSTHSSILSLEIPWTEESTGRGRTENRTEAGYISCGCKELDMIKETSCIRILCRWGCKYNSDVNQKYTITYWYVKC